jgi:hypothetical protein
MNRAPLSPASALVAHAESVLAGGRILLVGRADSSLAEHLLERGARLVQVLDADPRRVAHAAAHNAERRISYAPLGEHGFRDAAFDCALVEDLAEVAQPAELVSGVRRAVGAQGIAIIACSSDEGGSGLLGQRRGALRFAAFSETVHSAFERVLLVAQTPFVGYAVVHLDLDNPPEPALDNGFLNAGGENADYYVAIAGRGEAVEAVEFEDMTIVQLPALSTLSDGQRSERAAEQRQARRLEALESELVELRALAGSRDVEGLRAELERRETWIRQLELRAESADARADGAEAELERLEAERASEDAQELDRLRERLDDAERVAERHQKEAKWAEDRVKRLERELEEALSEAAKGPSEEVASLSRGLASERARAEQLGEKLNAEKSLRERAERRADELATALAQSRAECERLSESRANEGEIATLEAQLVERGQAVQALERDLAQLEVYTKSLSAELALRAEAGNSVQERELERELDALCRSLAEREADLVAATWKIGHLERQLSPGS